MDEWDFDKTMEELWKVARNDNIITIEERSMLKQIEMDAELYTMMLDECLADGIIDDHEAFILKDIESMIHDKAKEIATSDGIFDDDEKAIIQKLCEILTNRFLDSS